MASEPNLHSFPSLQGIQDLVSVYLSIINKLSELEQVTEPLCTVHILCYKIQLRSRSYCKVLRIVLGTAKALSQCQLFEYFIVNKDSQNIPELY